LSDFLATRNYLGRHYFVAIVQIAFAGVFGVLGVLFLMSSHHHSSTPAVAIILAMAGLGFGVYLVVFPSIVAETFGPENFGKYFGFLQISSSIASVTMPLIATAIYQASGNYIIMNFTLCGLLFLAGIAISRKPKQDYQLMD
jgi:OFA family oxalate/formate antiporter-like MFS transporter